MAETEQITALRYLLRLSPVAVGLVVLGTLAWLRNRRKKTWGKEHGLTHSGNAYSGTCRGIAVTVELEESVTARGSGLQAAATKSHHMFVRAAAKLPVLLPAGFRIDSIRFRGAMEGEPVQTPDSEFHTRLQVHAQDGVGAKDLMAVPGIARLIVDACVASPDLSVRDNTVFTKVGMMQETTADPRTALDKAFWIVMHVAESLSQCSQNGALLQPYNAGPPRPARVTKAPRLPQPRPPRTN